MYGTPKGKNRNMEAGYLIEEIIFGNANKEYWNI